MTPRLSLPLGSALCALLLTLSAGCDKAGDAKTDDQAKKDGQAKTDDQAKKDAKPALPTETEALALDQDGNQIPATIMVPKGSTIFADDPTTLRISYDKGELFGVQITAGNEFNLNLAETEAGMLENKYGNTNKILEKTDTLLRWSMTSDDTGHTNHLFKQIVKLGDKQWVCGEGNWGGWTEEQSLRQLEACKTLAAK